MDEYMMMNLAALPLPIVLSICFVMGLLLGYVYFRKLNTTSNLLVSSGNPLLSLALTVGRLWLLAAVFYAAVLLGGWYLLALVAGFVCTKYLMMLHVRKSHA